MASPWAVPGIQQPATCNSSPPNHRLVFLERAGQYTPPLKVPQTSYCLFGKFCESQYSFLLLSRTLSRGGKRSTAEPHCKNVFYLCQRFIKLSRLALNSHCNSGSLPSSWDYRSVSPGTGLLHTFPQQPPITIACILSCDEKQ